MNAEHVYPRQVVITVNPRCALVNSQNETKWVHCNEPLIVIKYLRSISERYIRCRFLNAQGEVLYNEFEYHHFVPVQSTPGMSITD